MGVKVLGHPDPAEVLLEKAQLLGPRLIFIFSEELAEHCVADLHRDVEASLGRVVGIVSF